MFCFVLCEGATFFYFIPSRVTHIYALHRRLVLYWSSARLFRSKCIYLFVYCSLKGKPTNEQQQNVRPIERNFFSFFHLFGFHLYHLLFIVIKTHGEEERIFLFFFFVSDHSFDWVCIYMITKILVKIVYISNSFLYLCFIVHFAGCIILRCRSLTLSVFPCSSMLALYNVWFDHYIVVLYFRSYHTGMCLSYLSCLFSSLFPCLLFIY